MNKLVEKDCQICEGTGIVEDRKGNEIICSTCKGKAKVYEKDKEIHEDSKHSDTERNIN